MTTPITRILVAVDFSSQSEDAILHAAAIARAVNARLELVHVVEDPFMSATWGESYVPDMRELLDSLASSARTRLERLRASHVADIPTEVAVIRGEPSRALVEHAGEGGFDLIVMGTHGRAGLSHIVLGSVAERVVRHAACPVLTVRERSPSDLGHATSTGRAHADAPRVWH